MGLLACIAILAIFLGFLFSPKGTDNQTSVRNGCLYLFVGIFVLVLIGGIISAFAYKPKTKHQRMMELVEQTKKNRQKRSDQRATTSSTRKKKEETKSSYKNESTKQLIEEKASEPTSSKTSKMKDKWADLSDHSCFYQIVVKKNKVFLSKFLSGPEPELVYKVEGVKEKKKKGYNLIFKSKRLTGSLRYLYSRHSTLTGTLIENNKSKGFKLEKDRS